MRSITTEVQQIPIISRNNKREDVLLDFMRSISGNREPM